MKKIARSMKMTLVFTFIVVGLPLVGIGLGSVIGTSPAEERQNYRNIFHLDAPKNAAEAAKQGPEVLPQLQEMKTYQAKALQQYETSHKSSGQQNQAPAFNTPGKRLAEAQNRLTDACDTAIALKVPARFTTPCK